MENRTVIEGRYIVDGQPLIINLIENPTIDDVLITESRIYASSLDRKDPEIAYRRVLYETRDFLIRIGVER